MKDKIKEIVKLFKDPTPSKLEEADRLLKQLNNELKERREKLATDERLVAMLVDAKNKVEVKAKATPIDELKSELEDLGVSTAPAQTKKEESHGVSGRFGHAVGNFLAEAKKALGDQRSKPKDEDE